MINDSRTNNNNHLVQAINNQSFEINDLKVQFQDKIHIINELKHRLVQCESPKFDSRIQKIEDENVSLAFQIVEIVLWYLVSRCSKHMTRHRDKLVNFISKFICMVRFGNDHFAAIMGYGDLQMRNILISRVYYVGALGHNLFSVGQFWTSWFQSLYNLNGGYDEIFSNLLTLQSLKDKILVMALSVFSLKLRFDEYFKLLSVVSTLISAATLPPPDTAGASLSTSIDKDAPYPSTSPNNEKTTSPINSTNVEEPHNKEVAVFDTDTFTNPFAPPVTSSAESSSRITSTCYRCLMVLFSCIPSDPKNYKEAMIESSWIEAMQKDIHEFERLEV
ncbi:hypothetical protein Tco_0085460 [Tanacetum coccineum]